MNEEIKTESVKEPAKPVTPEDVAKAGYAMGIRDAIAVVLLESKQVHNFRIPWLAEFFKNKYAEHGEHPAHDWHMGHDETEHKIIT